MPAPKDPKKYKEWIAKLRSAKNSGRFTKGHKRWNHPDVRKNWIKKGQRLSPKTEFKKRSGKWKTPQGYIMVYSPKHPYRNASDGVVEHRLIMEKSIGRYLIPGEIVHHKNGDITDNRIENLEITNLSDHAKYHEPWNHVRV